MSFGNTVLGLVNYVLATIGGIAVGRWLGRKAGKLVVRALDWRDRRRLDVSEIIK